MIRILDSCDGSIAEAVRLLRQGELVAFPTETVYGLGADATSDTAVTKIFAAKGRPANNPLIVHVHDIDAARRWAAEWPREALLLANAFWPGPITLIVKAGGQLSRLALAGGTTVGLRIPAHPIALRLLQACELPIAAPSANSSGHLSPVEAQHVIEDMREKIAAVIDGGRCDVGIESTVIDLASDEPVILRPGMISKEEIERVLQRDVRLHHVSASPTSGALKSPGLLRKHYAPRVPFKLLTRSQVHAAPAEVAAILFDAVDTEIDLGNVHVLPADPHLAARQLYALLWKLQDSGVREIWMESPPHGEAWEAILDRVRRASSL